MHDSYEELKALLDNPDIDAKAQLALPEAIRYVYYRFPHQRQRLHEISTVRGGCILRVLFLLVLIGASWYEGFLGRAAPLLALLVFYEYAYTSRRLQAVDLDFASRAVEYQLRKQLLLSRLFPSQFAADEELE